MQLVNMAFLFRPKETSRRCFTMNHCLKFADTFFYDFYWLKWGFWFCREGTANMGIRQVLFTDANTGVLLKSLDRTDMPNTLFGYTGLPDGQVFGLGHTVRYEFNIGRPVYRTYPCMLSPRNAKLDNTNSLVSRSDYSAGSWYGYWKPRMETHFEWCLSDGSSLQIVQHEYPSRYCVKVEPVSVNIERRFTWV